MPALYYTLSVFSVILVESSRFASFLLCVPSVEKEILPRSKHGLRQSDPGERGTIEDFILTAVHPRLSMSSQEIRHSYRAVLRASLRAIQFAKPARYTLVSRLRLAFTKTPASAYNPHKITNTLEFLEYARAQTGLEHKIVKNLLLVWWNQDKGGKGYPNRQPP
jgi:hypothetical protein